ncbi:hypothetical protein BGZ46_001170 [Entomortierella lignicola]|nr:hypothetical protein BGZ46_001170 [Entomortierella lignicola]
MESFSTPSVGNTVADVNEAAATRVQIMKRIMTGMADEGNGPVVATEVLRISKFYVGSASLLLVSALVIFLDTRLLRSCRGKIVRVEALATVVAIVLIIFAMKAVGIVAGPGFEVESVVLITDAG